MAEMLQGEGMVRAADALLHGNGGRCVLLRLPGPAASGDDAEQLGLATPGFQDVALTPVVFRKAESTAKMLVSGSAIKGVVGTLAYESAEVLFEAAVGVVVDEVLFVIASSVASEMNGEAYCYCLTLKAPVA